MDKWHPGPVIVDIGAGMGGTCRILAAEYGCEPIGIEYVQANVNLANKISQEVEMPEYVRLGDATKPLGVENADGAILFGVLNSIPRSQKVLTLTNAYNCLKPGGLLFYEDIVYKCLLEDFPELKHEDRDANSHLFNASWFHCIR